MTRAGCGLAALALAGCIAAPVPPPGPDQLTVSGRYGLPRAADERLAGRIVLAGLNVEAGTGKSVGLSDQEFLAAWRGAIEKSLGNHGYLAAQAAEGAIPITVRIASITPRAAEKGTQVAATLDITGGQDTLATCLTFKPTAEFLSLTPQRGDPTQRNFAIVSGLLLAALAGSAGGSMESAQMAGTSIGNYMGEQLVLADAQEDAANLARPSTFGQAVAPGFSPQDEARHAATFALQLAIAAYISHIGDPSCLAPPPAEAVSG